MDKETAIKLMKIDSAAVGLPAPGVRFNKVCACECGGVTADYNYDTDDLTCLTCGRTFSTIDWCPYMWRPVEVSPGVFDYPVETCMPLIDENMPNPRITNEQKEFVRKVIAERVEDLVGIQIAAENARASNNMIMRSWTTNEDGIAILPESVSNINSEELLSKIK